MTLRESGQNRCLFVAVASLWHNKLTNLSASLFRKIRGPMTGRWLVSTCVPFGWAVVHLVAANHVGLITSALSTTHRGAPKCFIHASRSIRGKLQLRLLFFVRFCSESWPAKWRVTGCRVLLPGCWPLHYVRGYRSRTQCPASVCCIGALLHTFIVAKYEVGSINCKKHSNWSQIQVFK